MLASYLSGNPGGTPDRTICPDNRQPCVRTLAPRRQAGGPTGRWPDRPVARQPDAAGRGVRPGDASPHPEHRFLSWGRELEVAAYLRASRERPPGRVWSTHPQRVSLAMIPGVEWHNPMKAPPCM